MTTQAVFAAGFFCGFVCCLVFGSMVVVGASRRWGASLWLMALMVGMAVAALAVWLASSGT